MQRDKPDPPVTKDLDPTSVEWILARLEEMKAERLAGTFPEDRETILARLVYGDYESYLYSPLWQKIRRRVLKRDGSICTRCGDRATQVHHLEYTEAVLKGDDDSQLVSVCKPCREKLNSLMKAGVDAPSMTGSGYLKTVTARGRRRLRLNRPGFSLKRERPKWTELGWGGVYLCKGNTEHLFWRNDGKVCTVPSADGQLVDAWMCSGCRHVLDHDREGQPRTAEQKFALLRKKPGVRYTRPAPQLGMTFTKVFWKLNAMQREGIMNEFDWNAALIKDPNLATTDPKHFAELQARYESTKRNGREPRKHSN